MNETQLLLADHQTLIRECLKCAVSRVTNIKVVGEALNRDDLSVDREIAPNVVCVNRHLPPDGGVAAIPDVRKHWPDAKIILMTDAGDVSICRSALLAGADGIVLMTSSSEDFIGAIHTVSQGEKSIPAALKESLENIPKPIRRADRTPLQQLSHRERQVLICLSRGMSYKHIAEKLLLGVKSIETYRARLFRKLNFDNKADLMRFAMDTGLMNTAMDI